MKFFTVFLSFIFSLSYNSYGKKEIEGKIYKVDNQDIGLKNSSDSGKKAFIPKPIGKVNDFENVLTLTQIIELDSIIKKFEYETDNQIAIVSVTSIDPYSDFFNFSFDLFNTWGIGQESKDNGLLIIFSKNLQQARITTGKGTERLLTDAKCKKIFEENMIPNFKNGLYYEAVKQGSLNLIHFWN